MFEVKYVDNKNLILFNYLEPIGKALILSKEIYNIVNEIDTDLKISLNLVWYNAKLVNKMEYKKCIVEILNINTDNFN